MTEAMYQQECLNTLKTLNNTVVTIRLYPVNAPQITTAIERGYKTVKQYLRKYGPFTFALRGSEQELCGEILDPQIVQSISNLIVFRQLQLLETDRLRIAPGLDRASFKKILELFSAKVDQIKKEGGGGAYISRLGLENCFVELDVDSEQEQGVDGAHDAGSVGRQELDVRREFVDVLLGRERRSAVIAELMSIFHVPSAGAAIVAAAIQRILEGMVQKRIFVTSSALQQVAENCDKMIGTDQIRELVAETVALLLKNVGKPAMTLLMNQNLQGDFGTRLCQSLEQQISIEMFSSVINELRHAAVQLRDAIPQSVDSRQLQFVTDAIERLLATPKGKQFLGQEKAKSIIEAGEKARRARRVEAGIKSLLQGNDEVLQNDEIKTHLPLVLQKLAAEGMDREIRAILAKLSAYYLAGDATVRSRMMASLAQIAENLAVGKRYALLKQIYQPLLHWLKTSEDGDYIYEKVCQALHGLMADSWRKGEFDVGDQILSFFYQIRSGTMVRPGPVRAIIGRTQDKGLDRELMKQLFQQCLDEPGDEVLSRRLILQGPIATSFLVDSLIRAEEVRDRMKIVDLLTYGEQFLSTILIEKLAEPMPWYGKRNLLKLLGDTGSAENLDIIYPFLHHDDLRVQREAFVCLYKVSGSRRTEALLRALNECGEIMKLQVVRALVPLGSSEVAHGLGQVLEEHRFYSDEFRDTLLANVCLAVARCPYHDAEKVLRQFLDQKRDRATRKIGARVWETAEEALKQSHETQQNERQLKTSAGQGDSGLLKPGGAAKDEEPARKPITGLADEQAICALVERGDKDAARIQLLDLITKMSRLRRFSQAERLREWLIEIDALALSDIIRAQEIIEEEKHFAVDKGHLETWSGLFDMLTTEEFNAFYHVLKHRRYRNDDVIIKKGTVQDGLFFINSGKVKLFYRDRDREVLAGTRQGGHILGINSFFDASIWTFSAAALGQVDISILRFEKMKGWQEKFPALESKLQDFCLKHDSAKRPFSREENDRRRFQRYQTPSQRLVITVLNETEQDGVATKGELVDLSRGGISCSMHIPSRENVRLLLGRKLRIALAEEEGAIASLTVSGVVVAVRAHHGMEDGYSVHVEFDSVLDKSEIERILQLL